MADPEPAACNRVTGADLNEGRPVARALRHPPHRLTRKASTCQSGQARAERHRAPAGKAPADAHRPGQGGLAADPRSLARHRTRDRRGGSGHGQRCSRAEARTRGAPRRNGTGSARLGVSWQPRRCGGPPAVRPGASSRTCCAASSGRVPPGCPRCSSCSPGAWSATPPSRRPAGVSSSAGWRSRSACSASCTSPTASLTRPTARLRCDARAATSVTCRRRRSPAVSPTTWPRRCSGCWPSSASAC